MVLLLLALRLLLGTHLHKLHLVVLKLITNSFAFLTNYAQIGHSNIFWKGAVAYTSVFLEVAVACTSIS